MYRKIIFPVDLSHIDQLSKALKIAQDLALHFKAELCFVGVTGTTPSEVAHNPQEYTAKLEDLSASIGRDAGVKTSCHACISVDPAVETDKTLLQAIKDLGADLVVMQTHTPNMIDYIWAGHGDTIAAKADISVFLVR